MTARIGLLACLALVALPGCGSDEGGSAERAVPELAGTNWTLDTSALGVTGAEDVKAPLSFEQDSAGGSDGCNRFSGPYTQDGDSLSFGPLVSTKMACAGAAGKVAAKVLPALGQVASFSLEGDRLTLEDASGEPLLAYGR